MKVGTKAHSKNQIPLKMKTTISFLKKKKRKIMINKERPNLPVSRTEIKMGPMEGNSSQSTEVS